MKWRRKNETAHLQVKTPLLAGKVFLNGYSVLISCMSVAQ